MAEGREHPGQANGSALPPKRTQYKDFPRINKHHPSDGQAMGTYTEKYIYDAVGNILEMHHSGTYPVHPGWNRIYTYRATRLLESGKYNNRLSNTVVGTGTPVTEPYEYDSRGNMTKMPHLSAMEWDFKDQLFMTQRQKLNNEDTEGIQRHGEWTYYVYDAQGQRVRKVTEYANEIIKEEVNNT